MAELIASYFIVSLLVYLLPTIIALIFGCDRTDSVFIMNLFLGWTFIGWVWAFIWAVSPRREQQKSIIINNHVSADRTINPVIMHAEKENTNFTNSQSFPKQSSQIEATTIKSHQLKIVQLQQLKKFLETGILTQEEFEQQKSKILAL